jgi:hypothetical protein
MATLQHWDGTSQGRQNRQTRRHHRLGILSELPNPADRSRSLGREFNLGTASSQQDHSDGQHAGGMRENLHLGTIGRTRVGVNWSVIVIVSFIALALATSVFPVALPGLATGIYWAAALVTAVLFLASLLGHELSHAVVARRRGVMVDGIVLWR